MPGSDWQAFYQSDLQAVYALLVAPLAFLVVRAVLDAAAADGDPRAARFVSLYTLAWAFETMVDPVATGPFARSLGSETGATLLALLFVLLGDLRVCWLVFALAEAGGEKRGGMRPLLRAAAWTPAVPVFAFAAQRGLEAVLGALPDNVLWMLHESAFVAVALFLARHFVPSRLPAGPRRDFLRQVLAYVAVYYALWAAADALILAGRDEGWALRALPNQLYYGLFVPFVAWRFRASQKAATSTSVQASR